MIAIPENKTRKRLRISLCVFYLIQIFLTTMPYLRGYNSNGSIMEFTVFDMLGYIGGNIPNSLAGNAMKQYILFMPIFIIIPIIGFFFCALDKQRNMKNIVSMLCCLGGVVSILLIISISFLDTGSLFALLFYVLMCFLTSLSMMARITDNTKNDKDKDKK